MKRFGVSLEDNLLDELDDLVKKHKLPNRSQAIRYLIRRNLTTEQWETNQVVSGCIVLVYDHHKRDLLNKAVDIQHQYHHLVLSSQHVHLDHSNCLETITLKGKAKKLKELADRLIGLKGMKHGQLVMSTLG
ncbi:MAG: nickel-responsive transcriptional regulator NikR [Candidatus Omnitrophica bacterium]|nr:nickel-responsive transcriptional regulator NikR [Candidatus Omnitrophota bacterium]